MHTRMPGKPARFIVFGSDIVWNGRLPLPTGGASSWRSSKGSSHLIKNWQGTGQDIRLVQMQQIASNAAWPSPGTGSRRVRRMELPRRRTTMGDCWSQYGHALGGEAVDSSQLLNLEGLFTFSPSNTSINLYTGDVVGLVPFSGAVAGLKPVLGPPRAILTWPNDQASAQIVNGILPMYAVLPAITPSRPTRCWSASTAGRRSPWGKTATTTRGSFQPWPWRRAFTACARGERMRPVGRSMRL